MGWQSLQKNVFRPGKARVLEEILNIEILDVREYEIDLRLGNFAEYFTVNKKTAKALSEMFAEMSNSLK